MHDANKIIPGIVLFLLVISFPIWYNVASGQDAAPPILEKPVNATKCVEDVEYMRVSHMQLLDSWRNEVVRNGNRIYVSNTDGTHHEMSLTKTCLGCHESREKFCTRCHDYMAVQPYCWECHVDPTEIQ